MFFLFRSLNQLRAARLLLRLNVHLRHATPRPILSQIREMKRKAPSPEPSTRKAAKVDDYCNVQPKKDLNGYQIWPAPKDQMAAARKFLREWYAHGNPPLDHVINT